MGQDQRRIRGGAEVGALATYEAPKIEIVLTPEDLEREVKYAGENGTPRIPD